MVSGPDSYPQLEQRFATWALTQTTIRAIIVVGSRARSQHSADEWSDLDLVVFAADSSPYLNNPASLDTFGQVRVARSHSFGQRDREWLALYDDGCKLDVAFLSIDPVATPTLQAMLDVFPYPNVLQRGVRVLIDKTRYPTELRRPTLDAPRRPTQPEFTALLSRMGLDALKTAKFIYRMDLWQAKQVCDGDLKQHLLTLLEWQAAVQADQCDVWYDGRFLDEWADAEAQQRLPATFAAYDKNDLVRALLVTLELAHQLAQEIAAKAGLIYPLETARFIDQHIRAILVQSDRT